ncbi:MAG: C39 family peptidase [Chitinivibrionales bacterium]
MNRVSRQLLLAWGIAMLSCARYLEMGNYNLSIYQDLHYKKETVNKENMIVDLNIKDRDWDPKRPNKRVGWCAEACIQMAMGYYGVEITQKEVNKAGSPRHADLYMDDIDEALKNLSVHFVAWDYNIRNLDEFIVWIKSMLERGYPVISGVKIYPDKYRRWFLDHFVLVVGYSKEGLLINTNIKGQQLISYSQLKSYNRGFAIKNRHDRYYARAIIGLSKKSTSVSATDRLSGFTIE